MTPATLDVIRLALVHDIHRHQKALDNLSGRTQATAKAGQDHRNAISDLQAAVADLDLEDTRMEAVGAMVAMLADWATHGPQVHFTCLESDLFAAVLSAYGRSTSAAVFRDRHAEADGDPSDVDHHDRRLLTRSA